VSAEEQAKYLSHGRLGIENTYEKSSNGSYYSIERLNTSGSVERLNGRPWSLVWSGDVSYRDSNSFRGATDFRRVRGHLYQAVLARRLDDGFVRFGRILPVELPGFGEVDGAQVETRADGPFKVGGVVGMRPDRIDLNFSGREPLAAAYSSLEAGTRGRWYYSGTLGVLQSLFRGTRDELAVLYDQRSDFGPKLNLFGTSQINFDEGGGRGAGTQLSRLNVYATSPLIPPVTLRAGIDRFERPDTRAERDLFGSNPNIPINITYRRYWVGADHALPIDLYLTEEVGFLDTGDSFSQSLWRVTLGHTGLPWLPQAMINATVYNIDNAEANGEGGILTATLPLLNGRLLTNIGVGARDAALKFGNKVVKLTDASGQVLWRVTSHWEARLTISEALLNRFSSTVINSALNYRW
jgi:hypothetical protein